MQPLMRLGLVAGLAALSGCAAPAQPPTGTPSDEPGLQVRTLPRPPELPASAFVGAEILTGRATFRRLDAPLLADSAAPLRLLNAVGKPVVNALVTVTSLDEQLPVRRSGPGVTLTDAEGRFEIARGVPGDRPCVVTVTFTGGHRLSALEPPGGREVEIDEGTSMVAELARWQVRPEATASAPDLADLTPAGLASLHDLSRQLLQVAPLGVLDGTTPHVPALKLGAGRQLRNLYVEAFGTRVTRAGDSAPPAANALADAWEEWLGFRPIALARAVGTGIRGYNQSDGVEAGAAQLVSPVDAVSDAFGNLYLTQYDLQLVSLVPGRAASGPAYGAGKASLAAGALHTIAGVVNGTRYPDEWDGMFRAQAAAGLKDGVPMFDADPTRAQGYPLFSPHKLVLEPAPAVSLSHVYFTQPFTGRVLLMPASEVRHFARQGAAQPYQARHLYCVAGRGMAPPDGGDWKPAADGEVGTSAGLHFPTGLARDGAGNLWILDAGNGSAGSGGLLVLRETDGLIFRVPLTRLGQPFTPDGAQDLRLSPDGKHLVVADTARHWVFRLPTPAVGPGAAPVAVERVAGRPPELRDDGEAVGTPGFLDTQQRPYPSSYEVSDGVADFEGEAPDPKAVVALLNRPGSICFDAAGDLLIGDTGNRRIRLKRGDRLYTVAGGLDTRDLTGDARLGYFPAIGYVNTEADGNVLVTDRDEALVRRLHTGRGTLVRRP